MDARPLGRCPFRVTSLGYGAFKIGRNVGIKYAAGYDLPDEAAATTLLNLAVDEGIRLFDTAPAYGLSEERIGRALSHRRRDVVLSTKVGETFEQGRSRYDFSAPAVRESVERSLRRLKTDVLDLVFIHAPADDLDVLARTDVVETLAELRDRGLVRAIGLSAKSVAAARAALAWADALMLEYHPLDRSHERLIDEAATARVGVVVKKGMAAGRIPAEQAVRFALANAGVDCLLVSTLSPEHLRENVRIAQQARAGPSSSSA